MSYGTINCDIVADSSGGRLAPISSVFRNRIINGAMVIDQRNAGASVTIGGGNTYTLDRFSGFASQASKYSIQQNASAVTPPVGFTNYLGATSLSAYTVGAAERFAVRHTIEGYNVADLGWGSANAKTITLSFWAYSSLTGTFGGALRNDAGDRSYPFSYSIPVANTWTQIAITITGSTSGTWGTTNNAGIPIWFSLGTGSTYSGTAGAWANADYSSATGATSVVGTNGATFYITGIQLERGSSATGFEYRQYGQELALCQRYLPAIAGAGNIPGTGAGASTTQVYISIPFQVQTRVPATGITTSAMSTFSVGDGAANFTPTSIGFQLAGLSSGFLDINFASGPAFGRAYYFNAANSSMKLLFTGCEL